ncbi:MAG: hypothetical protein H8E32_16190, partial [Nitrospinae bacterium]|nr:hypothetical protein [Nitrospinota bacterium]
MKKMFTAIPLIAMLMLLGSTAFAHDDAHEGDKHGHDMVEEGSGGSAMEMDRKSRAMAHEYNDEHGGDPSKATHPNKTAHHDPTKTPMHHHPRSPPPHPPPP